MTPYARRRDFLARALRDANVSALLVAKECNVSYLTGFTGDSSFLLVTPSRTILVSDDRYRIQIGEECPELEAHIRGHNRNTYQAVGEVVTQFRLSNLAVEAAGVTLEEFERLNGLCKSAALIGVTGFVERLRAIKDDGEITAIRKAIHVAENAFAALRAIMRPSDSEKDLADTLDGFLRRGGATCSAFPAIIGVGERSALPHGRVSHRKVEMSPFLLVDWGARVGQYHSDLTRVIWAPGAKPSRDVASRLEKLYTVVLTAQTRAIAAIRPGVSVKDVDAAARGFIADSGFGDFFNHGLGHGLGLEVHEAPSVRSNSDDVLEAGMVLTIEPGVYLPDFAGVRIEDDILVTSDGAEVLTTVSNSWVDP